MISHAILISGGNKILRKEKLTKLLSVILPESQQDNNRTSGKKMGKTHPDLHFVVTPENKKNISIAQMRSLKFMLNKKPFQADSKVAVIADAHKMTVEAQNSFLKTLEEPPKNSYLLLETQNASSLLPTVISRCQNIKLPSKVNLDLDSDQHKKNVEDFLKNLGWGRGERLDFIEDQKAKINDQKYSLALIDSWASVLRDSLLINEGLKKEIINKQIISYQLSVINSFEKDKLVSAIKQLEHIKKVINVYNVSPRLAIEAFLLNLPAH